LDRIGLVCVDDQHLIEAAGRDAGLEGGAIAQIFFMLNDNEVSKPELQIMKNF